MKSRSITFKKFRQARTDWPRPVNRQNEYLTLQRFLTYFGRKIISCTFVQNYHKHVGITGTKNIARHVKLKHFVLY